jgi:hypothetical protein
MRRPTPFLPKVGSSLMISIRVGVRHLLLAVLLALTLSFGHMLLTSEESQASEGDLTWNIESSAGGTTVVNDVIAAVDSYHPFGVGLQEVCSELQWNKIAYALSVARSGDHWISYIEGPSGYCAGNNGAYGDAIFTRGGCSGGVTNNCYIRIQYANQNAPYPSGFPNGGYREAICGVYVTYESCSTHLSTNSYLSTSAAQLGEYVGWMNNNYSSYGVSSVAMGDFNRTNGSGDPVSSYFAGWGIGDVSWWTHPTPTATHKYDWTWYKSAHFCALPQYSFVNNPGSATHSDHWQLYTFKNTC